METSSEDTAPKKNSRLGSSGRAAMPRRPTRGPLDLSEASISSPLSPINPSQLLSPRSSTALALSPNMRSPGRSPRLPSPGHNSVPSLALPKDFSYLLQPEIYHPLPLMDVPGPFRTAQHQPPPDTPLETLVSSGHFRHAAIKAAQLLMSPTLSPSDHSQIFSLIYTRLACLTLCNQTTLAAQEIKSLEDLSSSTYLDPLTSTHLVPWPLRVLAIRLQGMGFNDARRGVMGYYDLGREARLMLSSLKPKLKDQDPPSAELIADIKMWEDRLADLGIRVASALVEMDDLEGAGRFLSTLKPRAGEEAGLGLKKALVWLFLGDLEKARDSVSLAGGDAEKVVAALVLMAEGRYGDAAHVWEELCDGAEGQAKGEKAMWRQNWGVCLLYLGKIDEARAILEGLISENESFHALTFNLSTIYELCTERSRAMKVTLAEKVAGIQEAGGGADKVNGDFKL